MAYLTARMVWAIANGWTKPKKSEAAKADDIQKLKDMGMVQEI